MMYPYMTLADETEIVHSQIIEKDGMRKVIVNYIYKIYSARKNDLRKINLYRGLSGDKLKEQCYNADVIKV